MNVEDNIPRGQSISPNSNMLQLKDLRVGQ